MTDAQKRYFDQLIPWLHQVFGDQQVAVAEDEAMADLHIGSAIVRVTVEPYLDDDAIYAFRSWVVSGAEPSPDLYRFLLRGNGKLLFGKFGLDAEGDITLDHALIASGCTRDELQQVAQQIVQTADDFDDPIMRRWGGERALDIYHRTHT